MPYSMMLYDDDDKAPPAPGDLFRVVAVEPNVSTHDTHWGRGTRALLGPYTGEDQLMAALAQRRAELAQAQTEIARVNKISDGYATGWADACAARDALARQLAEAEAKRLHWFGIAQEQAWRLATLDAAEAALADCGIGGIYDTFNSLTDAIEQMSSHIHGLGERLEEAEQRAAAEKDIAAHYEKNATAFAHLHAEAKQRAERAEALAAGARKAAEWLWGFYDGNTLIAKPGYEDDIHDKACGELAQTVRTERAERQEAEHLAEAFHSALLEAHKALDEYELGAYDEPTANVQTRISWLGKLVDEAEQRAERAEALVELVTLSKKVPSERAEALAALVTEELAALLEYLAEGIDCLAPTEPGVPTPTKTDDARATAARIREILDEH